MSDPGAYIPERFDEDHVKVLVRIKPCAMCKRATVPNLSKAHSDPFPAYHRAQFQAQIERSDVLLVGNYTGNREPVCVECVKAGAVTVECALCKQQRGLDQLEDSIGYPPEHLCKHCYETAPAKVWAEELKRLEEKHRWDFD